MPRVITPLYWFVYFLSSRLSVAARFRYRWVVHPDAKRRPLIVAAKHTSYWDVPTLSQLCNRFLGCRPYFEMGSFHGYPVIGRLRWLLKAVGGFEVMRGKDLLRLKQRTGKDKSELSNLMRTVNEQAAAHRAAILREGGILCFFPEGTRNPSEIRPVKARLELEEAIALATAERRDAWVAPVAIKHGLRPAFVVPFFRRQAMDVIVGAPIQLRDAVVDRVIESIVAHWRGAYPEAA